MIEFLNRKLRDDVEGMCSGKYGYIIKVVAVLDVGQGKIMPGTGLAEFRSRYQAIVLKPFNGEVMDALVTNVNKMGFFAEVGPLSILCRRTCCRSTTSFSRTQIRPSSHRLPSAW